MFGFMNTVKLFARIMAEWVRALDWRPGAPPLLEKDNSKNNPVYNTQV